MDLFLKYLLPVLTAVISGIVVFITTRHNLENKIKEESEKIREAFRTQHDVLKDKIHALELELQKQKNKDELQQQVIDQIVKQLESLIPNLLKTISTNKNKADD